MRIFLVDHVTAGHVGHNLMCLDLFADQFKSASFDVISLVSELCSKSAGSSQSYERVLHYPYQWLIPSSHTDDSNTIFEDQSHVASNRLVSAFAENVDSEFEKTLTNWQQVFERFRITAEDAIFFPSAEHYGFGALMVLMANLPQELRPKVHARLIAVLEGASAKSEFGRAELFKSVALARKTGVDVSFSAETLAYQDYLKNIFREDIYLLQYPIFGRPTVVNWKKRPFKIVTPGQGRADKGFFEILKLANLLKSSHGEGEVEIVLQKMKPTDVYYRQSYVQSLLEHPMISVKPAFVEEDELDWMYRDSHVLFMPYARDVYAQRGSAVFQEGVSRGRCFIASDGTGVSGMIRHYENGILVKDMQNVADAVSRFMGMSQTEAFAMSHHARCTYQDDFNDQFGRLCGTLSGE